MSQHAVFYAVFLVAPVESKNRYCRLFFTRIKVWRSSILFNPRIYLKKTH